MIIAYTDKRNSFRYDTCLGQHIIEVCDDHNMRRKYPAAGTAGTVGIRRLVGAVANDSKSSEY